MFRHADVVFLCLVCIIWKFSMLHSTSTYDTSLDTTVVTGDLIRAEVLWTLKVVMCHYSFIWNNVS